MAQGGTPRYKIPTYLRQGETKCYVEGWGETSRLWLLICEWGFKSPIRDASIFALRCSCTIFISPVKACYNLIVFEYEWGNISFSLIFIRILASIPVYSFSPSPKLRGSDRWKEVGIFLWSQTGAFMGGISSRTSPMRRDGLWFYVNKRENLLEP